MAKNNSGGKGSSALLTSTSYRRNDSCNEKELEVLRRWGHLALTLLPSQNHIQGSQPIIISIPHLTPRHQQPGCPCHISNTIVPIVLLSHTKSNKSFSFISFFQPSLNPAECYLSLHKGTRRSLESMHVLFRDNHVLVTKKNVPCCTGPISSVLSGPVSTCRSGWIVDPRLSDPSVMS